MIQYKEKTKDSTQRLLDLIRQFGNLIESEINTQKINNSYTHPYTHTHKVMPEKELVRLILFTVASKHLNTLE